MLPERPAGEIASFKQAVRIIVRTSNIYAGELMKWNSASNLPAERLVFLMFDHLASAQWVGYVNRDGICEWPEQVRGYRPTAWQEVIVDLTRIKAVGG
ncbi:hypothetical protein [Rhizobium sp. NFR07]|uniref:hypothetical protein n=1 Tax=Rhizobium sp. NFR07 TaxID=1566262 RepID=UPI001160337A|nr:hypothetical protein [Rhizobium sp. NFR07]